MDKNKPISLTDVAVFADSKMDNVVLSKRAIPMGSVLCHENIVIQLPEDVNPSDRFALRDIFGGEYLIQYGYPFAKSKGIQQGEKITCDNTLNEIPPLQDSFRHIQPRSKKDDEILDRSFMGYRRADGRCGTRNYYVILPTSMCASAVAQQIAGRFDIRHPGIDAIIALPNTEGCGCAAGLQIERFLTVLHNIIIHENVGGVLIVDLGCEQTNYSVVYKHLEKGAVNIFDKPIDWLTIQQVGGSPKTVAQGINIVSQRLQQVGAIIRRICPLSALTVGSECGASDAFSGITANCVIGYAIDKIVAAGGSAILSEFPEMVGAEQVLFPRMRNAKVREKFTRQMNWYSDMANRLGTSMDHNLVPENKAGGLINPFIKSLGAVMKGGTAIIEDVLDYGERVHKKGLNIMQGPGNDLESVTGLAASGANIICFSTGRGTVTGCALVPVIKISSTSELYSRMSDDMDFDAGVMLESHSTEIAHMELGERLHEMIISVASGQLTKPEINQQRQFQIWTAGKLSL